MEPSDILKEIKSYLKAADKEVKAEAKRIFTTNGSIACESMGEDSFYFTIYSKDSYELHDVNINWGKYEANCACSVFMNGEICAHVLASMMYLERDLKKSVGLDVMKTMLKQGNKKAEESATIDNDFIFKSSVITKEIILQHCDIPNWSNFISTIWYDYSRRVNFDRKNKCVTLQYSPTIQTTITYHSQNKLKVNCGCRLNNSQQLCKHAIYCLARIYIADQMLFFKDYDDVSIEKALLLKKYDLEPDDHLAKGFKFKFDENGQLYVADIPNYLIDPKHEESWNLLKSKLSISQTSPTSTKQIESERYEQMGLLLTLSKTNEPYIKIEILGIRQKKSGAGNVYKRMHIRTEPSLRMIAEFYPKLPDILMPLNYDRIEQDRPDWRGNWDYLPSSFKSSWLVKLRSVFQQLVKHEGPINFFILSNENTYKSVFLQKFKPEIHIIVSRQHKYIQLEGWIKLGADEKVRIAETIFHPMFLLNHGVNFYLIEDTMIDVIKMFSARSLFAKASNFDQLNRDILLPLSANCIIEYDESMKLESIDLSNQQPQLQITLSELSNEFLLLTPSFRYDTLTFDFLDHQLKMNDTTLAKVSRNVDAEEVLRKWVQQIHPSFNQKANAFYYLSIKEAKKDQWYFNFLHEANNQDVILIGTDTLTNFNFNTSMPTMEVNVSKGIDWFDVQIEVHYGGLVVPLSELKKAILNQQSFVNLSDGTLGVIPEEWIEKYSYLLRSAKLNKDTLEVSKFQWTVVDQLYDAVNDVEVEQELNRKKELLVNIDTQKKYKQPKKVNATLRDYQLAGFQWLCTLDSMEWGGCLADDMGLGKTLQTLCFIAHLNQKEKKTHLIVCPTSLIYNWESEILKFCKHLTYVIHYGNERSKEMSSFTSFDIVITTYGMVRSDIEQFANLEFSYVILDESHAIKNPVAQVTKAVNLLRSKNRIALSGTPLQNNTMDIYSQMNFLNKGMLGSVDSFKSEFATPIDKHGDATKTALLKKILYPFMLRRTKEQVAKDLPDKTESILWCEMESEQRKIYNSFKEYYRKLILNKIEEEGMNKSSFFILEGLLKLRQICDSPAILNEDVKYPNESVKMEEIVRELEENTGQHKALVFSQFVSMLKLIEGALIERDIEFLYLDGQTKAMDRKKAVAEFQANANCKVMLISLKAGGVGLNLTEADYVYLVDPWWNPAVEQQAIDRTHRIGQQKKVFAYKMICKDSIEEKIMMLQEKKKSLSADIVGGETSFIKKLTRDDIQFLFS